MVEDREKTLEETHEKTLVEIQEKPLVEIQEKTLEHKERILEDEIREATQVVMTLVANETTKGSKTNNVTTKIIRRKTDSMEMMIALTDKGILLNILMRIPLNNRHRERK